MAEPIESIQSVERVTEVKKAPPTVAPFIVHTVDEHGTPLVRGRFQYTTFLVPVGSEVNTATFVNGEIVVESGVWIAVAQDGKNAIVQTRLAVDDNCALDTLEPVEAEAE